MTIDPRPPVNCKFLKMASRPVGLGMHSYTRTSIASLASLPPHPVGNDM